MSSAVADGATVTDPQVLPAVLAALATVRDPELDEPVTALGFVASCHLSTDGVAHVRLRLPTYFCAPNFAFLMVADAFDVVSAVPGVTRADVVLEDHFASDTINAGVAARAGFVGSFDGEAVDELDGLRTTFLRKAVMAGTDVVCRPLVAGGASPQDLAAMTLAQAPPGADLERLRGRRAQLGLPHGPSDPVLVDVETGRPLRPDDVPVHLRKARTTRVSLEANGSVCRGMLRHRYSAPGEGEEPS